MRFGMFTGMLVLAALLVDCTHSGKHKMSDAEFMRRVKEYNQEVEKHDQVSCERVRPIGSNIPQWVCVKKWSKNLERLETQDVMRRMQRVEGQAGK